MKSCFIRIAKRANHNDGWKIEGLPESESSS